jgi:uncharacterized peroxidase-related enzyme
MKPMYLREIETYNPPGERGEAIRQMKQTGIPVPQIMHLLAYRPEKTDHLWQFTQAVMRGASELSPALRELIGAYTSRLNHCAFCVGSHAAVAAELLGDKGLVQAVLDDYHSAPISDQEKALFQLVEKIIRDPKQVGAADIELAKHAGWSDEALFDTITTCALFSFYNTWVSATGVSDMPEFMYAMAGISLASNGYTNDVAQPHATGVL